MSIPISQFIPPPANHKFVFYICDSICFVNKFTCTIFLDSTCKRIFVFLCLTYFTQDDNLQVHPCCCKWHYYYYYFLKFIYFILLILFLAALGLCCCMQAFSSCGEQGLLFVVVCGLLIVVASLVAEHRLQACGLQQLQHTGSVVVARGLQSAGSVVVAHGPSCSAACGIFPDQGSNPCPLQWQADSQPLRHQGSPILFFFNGGVIFHCICVPHLLYPFHCRWTFRWLPRPGYCKQYCNEHWGACIFLNYGFLQTYAQEWDCWIIWQCYFQFFKEPPYCSP